MAKRNLVLAVLLIACLETAWVGAASTPAHGGGGSCNAFMTCNSCLLSVPGCTVCSSKNQARCSKCNEFYQLRKGTCAPKPGVVPTCDGPVLADSTLAQDALGAPDWATFEPLYKEIMSCEASEGVLVPANDVAKCISWCTARHHTICLPSLSVPIYGPKLYAACMALSVTKCAIECNT